MWCESCIDLGPEVHELVLKKDVLTNFSQSVDDGMFPVSPPTASVMRNMSSSIHYRKSVLKRSSTISGVYMNGAPNNLRYDGGEKGSGNKCKSVTRSVSVS